MVGRSRNRCARNRQGTVGAKSWTQTTSSGTRRSNSDQKGALSDLSSTCLRHGVIFRLLHGRSCCFVPCYDKRGEAYERIHLAVDGVQREVDANGSIEARERRHPMTVGAGNQLWTQRETLPFQDLGALGADGVAGRSISPI